jgi:hypothetical protein
MERKVVTSEPPGPDIRPGLAEDADGVAKWVTDASPDRRSRPIFDALENELMTHDGRSQVVTGRAEAGGEQPQGRLALSGITIAQEQPTMVRGRVKPSGPRFMARKGKAGSGTLTFLEDLQPTPGLLSHGSH